MERLELEALKVYKQWLVKRLNKVVKKIELAYSSPGMSEITKDFIYVSDILDIINNNEYESYKPPLREYDVLDKYFDSIDMHHDKKTKSTIMKCRNLLNYKASAAHNFYEIIISTCKKTALVLGHIAGQPYEYRYYYRDLYHLDRICRETYIQNCLYAKYEKQPDLIIKGDIENETR